MIPYKSINISDLNELQQNSLASHLKMEVVEIGEDFLTMSMPVEQNVMQPMGVLHGGATAALAENVASLAGLISLPKDKACVGLTLNANHIKSVRSGTVFAKAMAIHLGRSTQVWEVEVRTEAGDLVSTIRMTMAVVDRK